MDDKLMVLQKISKVGKIKNFNDTILKREKGYKIILRNVSSI